MERLRCMAISPEREHGNALRWRHREGCEFIRHRPTDARQEAVSEAAQDMGGP